MASKSDNELVEKVQSERCEESLKELIRRHTALCYMVYQRYYPIIEQQGHGKIDFLKEKDYIIYESALTYNPERAKFDTWVGKRVFYFCVNNLRRGKHTQNFDHETLNDIVDKSSHTPPFNEDIKDFVLDILGRLKDKRIKTIYEMRYFEDATQNIDWRNIAHRMNISVQTAINLHDSAQKILKAKLTSNSLIDTI